MNLLKVISSEESIGGLEINGENLRFSLLKNKRGEIKSEVLAEKKMSLEKGENNEISLANEINSFASKNLIKYVIISLPSDNVFVKSYSFPATMEDEKVKDSMQLIIDLQLPQKKEEIYCDWMKLEGNSDKKILLSYIDKKYIDTFLDIIKKTDVRIVAIESSAMSLARAIKQAPSEPFLIVEKNPNYFVFSVIKDNNLLFSQSAPIDKINKGLSKEINRILNYHEWFNLPIKNLILLGDFEKSEIKKLPIPA